MKPPEAWKRSLYYKAGEGKLPGAFLQLLAQATCVPFHGARKGVEICVTYWKFLTHRHLIPPCSTVVFVFQRAVAVVDVAGHSSGVIAELHREVLPTRVPQLAVLSLAGTRGTVTVGWDQGMEQTLLPTNSQLHEFPALELQSQMLECNSVPGEQL